MSTIDLCDVGLHAEQFFELLPKQDGKITRQNMSLSQSWLYGYRTVLAGEEYAPLFAHDRRREIIGQFVGSILQLGKVECVEAGVARPDHEFSSPRAFVLMMTEMGYSGDFDESQWPAVHERLTILGSVLLGDDV